MRDPRVARGDRELVRRFDARMHSIYEGARRLTPPYTPSAFRKMLGERGGLGTADTLLATPDTSAGFTELFLRGKENLRLSVEYVVLESPWNALFSDSQLAVARRRLEQVGVEPPEPEQDGQVTTAQLPVPGDGNPEVRPYVDQFDLASEPDELAERSRVMALAPYPRSKAVRVAVLARAKGACEWCRGQGFLMDNGSVFLETHHVEPLNEGGVDHVTNVVALCPTHHREAHFGVERATMRTKLAAYANGDSPRAV